MSHTSLARFVVPALLGALLLVGPGCGGGDDEGAGTETPDVAPPAAPTIDIPADLPFDASEWTTNNDYAPLGSPDAVKDDGKRAFTLPWLSFPPTLRTEGPNANLTTTRTVHSLMFESLVQLDPETSEFMPCLASHWKVEKDDASGTQTFTFRINEKARWANGDPVTAADVFFTYWHYTQEDRQEPSTKMTYEEGFEVPEVLDRLTIRVKTRNLNWRLFSYFGGMAIYPARECSISGKQYLDEYNWKFMVGTGPYEMASEKDIKTGESLTLTRRDDWWAENEKWAQNTYNFQRIKFLVLRDEELIWEKFKKGELDWYQVNKAQRWVEIIPTEDVVQRGVVQIRKIYNEAPNGYSGLAFNMRKAPFDKKEVRMAFAHLFNRERLIDKLFFNQYEPINSLFPGRDWGAGDENPMVYFDPERASELLAQAGYKNRDSDGFLVGPDGKRFSVTLQYANQGWERIWLVVKEDYEAAGIEFNLKLIDPSTLTKLITERQFTLHFQGYNAMLFPNPETSWRSDLADKPANNNIVGFKNAAVDELFKKYNEVFTRPEQKAITRQIDKLVCAEYPYAFGWYGPYVRLLYWNRFGHPAKYVTRTTQLPENAIMLLWWFDPARTQALEATGDSGTMPQYEGEGPEHIVRPWAKK